MPLPIILLDVGVHIGVPPSFIEIIIMMMIINYFYFPPYRICEIRTTVQIW